VINIDTHITKNKKVTDATAQQYLHSAKRCLLFTLFTV